MKSLLPGLLVGLLAGAAGTVAFHIASQRIGSTAEGEDAKPGRSVFVEVPSVLAGKPEVTPTVYLNREGALLTPGVDDARENVSSLVMSAGVKSARIPAFRGTHKQWTQIVDCVRGQFAPYDAQVVDQRPVGRRYVMAVIGGTPDDLGGNPTGGEEHNHAVTGLAPYTGEPIADAVVLVFSHKLRRRLRPVCETAAMEIAHSFGLDHGYNCRDLMSYLRPCGKRSFRDEVKPCGEHEPRPCKNGAETQSSHARLMEILGPRKGE